MSLPGLDAVRALAPVPDAWLVGGSVRDLLLGRQVVDVDLVVERDPAAAAARRSPAATAARPSRSRSGTAPGAWCATATRSTSRPATAPWPTTSAGATSRSTRWRCRLPAASCSTRTAAGPTSRRGGCGRSPSRCSSDDPLRLLRLVRLAHELGFDRSTPSRERLARRDAPPGRPAERRAGPHRDPPAARAATTLTAGIRAARPDRRARRRPARGRRRCGGSSRARSTTSTCSSTPCRCSTPRPTSPPTPPTTCAERCRAGAGGAGRRGGQRLHGAHRPAPGRALPRHREAVATRVAGPDGRVSFMGHDRLGADTAELVLERWKASHALIRFCRVLVSEHLRLGFLVRERPFDRRTAYRYAAATAPYTLESVVLSLADRLATRGVRARQAYLRAHAEAAVELIGLIHDARGGAARAAAARRRDRRAHRGERPPDRRARRSAGRGAGGGGGHHPGRGGRVCRAVAASTARPGCYAAHAAGRDWHGFVAWCECRPHRPRAGRRRRAGRPGCGACSARVASVTVLDAAAGAARVRPRRGRAGRGPGRAAAVPGRPRSTSSRA